jgi:hypothetical protein
VGADPMMPKLGSSRSGDDGVGEGRWQANDSDVTTTASRQRIDVCLMTV